MDTKAYRLHLFAKIYGNASLGRSKTTELGHRANICQLIFLHFCTPHDSISGEKKLTILHWVLLFRWKWPIASQLCQFIFCLFGRAHNKPVIGLAQPARKTFTPRELKGFFWQPEHAKLYAERLSLNLQKVPQLSLFHILMCSADKWGGLCPSCWIKKTKYTLANTYKVQALQFIHPPPLWAETAAVELRKKTDGSYWVWEQEVSVV